MILEHMEKSFLHLLQANLVDKGIFAAVINGALGDPIQGLGLVGVPKTGLCLPFYI